MPRQDTFDTSMMKKIILYIALFTALSDSTATAQVMNRKNPGAYFKNAEKEFGDQRYMYAIPFYRASLKTGRTYDSVALLHLADCYWHIKNYDSARVYYEQYESKFRPLISDRQRLAELSANQRRYNQAVEGYQKILKERPDAGVARARLTGFSNVEPFLRDSLDIAIKLLKLNTQQQDFSPQFFRAGMVFVSNRYVKSNAEREFGWDGLPYANIYWVKDTADLYVIDSMPGRSARNYNVSIKANDDYTDKTSNDNDVINVSSMRGAYAGEIHRLAKFTDDLTSKYNYGPLCFSRNGSTVFFTRNNKKPFEGRYNLEICEAHFDKGAWGSISVLPFVQPGHDFYHPAISEDGQRLYFCSNKPGGFGGSDIYYAYIVNDTVKNEAFNIGDIINTAGDEVFPTVGAGDIFYFSSDGHAGLGGLDLYRTAPGKNKWEIPVNLGYPLNSSFDDFGIIYSPSKSKGFFSSNRLGTDDIFTFTNMPYVVTLEGTVLNKSTMRRLDIAKVILRSATDNELLIDSFTTGPGGNFHFAIKAGRAYTLQFSRKGFYDDSIRIDNSGLARELALTPERMTPVPTPTEPDRDGDGVVDSKDKCPDIKGLKENFGCPDIQSRFNELAKMVFFKTASAELSPESIRPLTEAYEILTKYPNTTLTIDGHTDNRSGAAYNKDLSQRRASSVKAFFVNKGLSAARFTTAGYGLEKPIADNGSEEGRAMNRRVGIKATFHE